MVQSRLKFSKENQMCLLNDKFKGNKACFMWVNASNCYIFKFWIIRKGYSESMVPSLLISSLLETF